MSHFFVNLRQARYDTNYVVQSTVLNFRQWDNDVQLDERIVGNAGGEVASVAEVEAEYSLYLGLPIEDFNEEVPEFREPYSFLDLDNSGDIVHSLGAGGSIDRM